MYEEKLGWWDWIRFRWRCKKQDFADWFGTKVLGYQYEFGLEMDGEFNFYRYFPNKCQDEPPCNVVRMNMTKKK